MQFKKAFSDLLQQATPSQLTAMFVNGDQTRLRVVAKRVHLKFSGADVTAEQAAQLVKACLRLPGGDLPRHLAMALSQPVSNDAEELLGDAFAEPTQDDLDAVTPKLVRRHGRLAVAFYYSYVIAGDNYASEMLKGYFGENALFEAEQDHQIPAPLPKPEPRVVDSATRDRRRQRRLERKKQAVVTVRAKPPTKRVKAKPKATRRSLTVGAPTPPQSKITVEPTRLVHPHVSQAGGFSTAHRMVGLLVTGYIHFDPANPASRGKARPCVVIAVGPEQLLVRPVYTNPYKFAGHWRSVRLDDWKQAGLTHPSHVGTDQHKIPHIEDGVLGRLTTHDWNRICRGEVNPVGNI